MRPEWAKSDPPPWKLYDDLLLKLDYKTILSVSGVTAENTDIYSPTPIKIVLPVMPNLSFKVYLLQVYLLKSWNHSYSYLHSRYM